MQLLSCLIGDRGAAELCNVIDVGKRMDAYTAVYQEVLKLLGESSGTISRSDVKRAVMTALYGSIAVPEEVFGEDVHLFYQAMSNLAPKAWELNGEFLKLWDPTTDKQSWILPDNFHVHNKIESYKEEEVTFLGMTQTIKYKVNAPAPRGRSIGANVCHSIDSYIVRELTRRCDYDVRQVNRIKYLIWTVQEEKDIKATEDAVMTKILWDNYLESGMLSARIFDYLNEYTIQLVDKDVIWELIQSLPAKPFKVLGIHDCFRVLPNYGNDLREQYNLQLHLIAKSDLLQFILRKLCNCPQLTVTKQDDISQDVLKANYALS